MEKLGASYAPKTTKTQTADTAPQQGTYNLAPAGSRPPRTSQPGMGQSS